MERSVSSATAPGARQRAYCCCAWLAFATAPHIESLEENYCHKKNFNDKYCKLVLCHELYVRGCYLFREG